VHISDFLTNLIDNLINVVLAWRSRPKAKSDGHDLSEQHTDAKEEK